MKHEKRNNTDGLHNIIHVLCVAIFIDKLQIYMHTCLVIVRQSHMTLGSHGYESSQSSPPETRIHSNLSIPQHTTNHVAGGSASHEGAGPRGR